MAESYTLKLGLYQIYADTYENNVDPYAMVYNLIGT